MKKNKKLTIIYLNVLFACLLFGIVTNSMNVKAAKKTPGLIYNYRYDDETDTLTLSVPYSMRSDSDAQVECPKQYRSTVKKIIIKNGVRNIAKSGFADCSKLTEIKIPNSVTYIYRNAFHNCKQLTSIRLPDHIKYLYSDTFSGCKNLSSVRLPKNLIMLESCFSGCSKLSYIHIPDGLEWLSGEVFKNCTSLTSIIIPDSVTSIDENCFSGCTNLAYVYVGTSVNTIGEGAFKNCRNLRTIKLPESVRQIRTKAFENCVNLETVRISYANFAADDLADTIFWGCSKLTLYGYSKSLLTYAQANKIPFVSMGDTVTATFCWNLPSQKVDDLIVTYGKGQKLGVEDEVISWTFDHIGRTKAKKYVFIGFYTQPTGGEKVTRDTICNANTTYYGQWEKVKKNGIYKSDDADIYLRIVDEKKKTAELIRIDYFNHPDRDVVYASYSIGGESYKIVATGPSFVRKLENGSSLRTYLSVIGKYGLRGTDYTTIILDDTVKIGSKAFMNNKNLRYLYIESEKLSNKNIAKDAFAGITADVIVKVPKKKYKQYAKLLHSHGLAKNVKIDVIKESDDYD